MLGQDDFPIMNADKSNIWQLDIEQSSSMMVEWLHTSAKEIISNLRSQEVAKISKLILELDGRIELSELILQNPTVLMILRALTIRDIGMSQFSTFTGYGGTLIKRIEMGETIPEREFALKAASILANEMDYTLVPWLNEKRLPDNTEVNRAAIIALDRILRRTLSTKMRYKHEPRQLGKLEEYLVRRGYSKIDRSVVRQSLIEMPNGTFSFGVNVEGKRPDGEVLKQQVDALIKPFSKSIGLLPIFLEAKSMSDTVNPNKRQKEEFAKVLNVRNKWQQGSNYLFFILLLGGTVPYRYLENEAGFGLDWIWEHRIEDLDKLFKWYAEK